MRPKQTKNLASAHAIRRRLFEKEPGEGKNARRSIQNYDDPEERDGASRLCSLAKIASPVHPPRTPWETACLLTTTMMNIRAIRFTCRTPISRSAAHDERLGGRHARVSCCSPSRVARPRPISGLEADGSGPDGADDGFEKLPAWRSRRVREVTCLEALQLFLIQLGGRGSGHCLRRMCLHSVVR